MTDIRLQSGKMISTTSNHMMVVYPDGKSTLKRASNVESGDIFFSYEVNGAMTEDRVVEVNTYFQDTAVANLIISGHVLANDVVASVRVDGDMPESLWKAGVLVNKLFGTAVTHQFCRFGNWFRQTRMASVL